MDGFIQWELNLLHAIQDMATPLWNTLWTAVTMLGESGIFWIVLALALLTFKKTRRLGLSMAFALVLGLIFCNGILKNAVARPRPYTLDPALFPRLSWGEMTKDFSFPSGHTTASFEGAVCIFIRNKKWGAFALALALLIGLSRLFLGVHYPSDIVAGALLGTTLAYLGSFFADRLFSRFSFCGKEGEK